MHAPGLGYTLRGHLRRECIAQKRTIRVTICGRYGGAFAIPLGHSIAPPQTTEERNDTFLGMSAPEHSRKEHRVAIRLSAQWLPLARERVGRQNHPLRQFLIANSPAPLMWAEIPFGFKGV